MEKIRDNKGITLIVLIITIIVLLIIAGISISGAINGIEEADTNRLITELEKVQHAVTERYSKYELTEDASVLVGTKIDLTSLTDVPQSVNWKVLQTTTASQTSTHPERKYYRLSKSDLENLGLTGDYRGSSYIVNYYSGEAYDEAEIQTSDGTVLYKTGIENEASELGDEAIQDGLQVWYDAINNTGSGHSNSTTTWKDLSGNGNDATLNGFDGTEASGWHSNYLAFDGSNDSVKTSKEIDYKNSGEVTIELTDINGNLKNNNNLAMIFESSTNWNNNNTGYGVDTNEGGLNHNFRFTIRNFDMGYHIKMTNNDLLNNNKNNSYTFVLNTNEQHNKYIIIYHNGRIEELLNSAGNANLSNSSKKIFNYVMYIGARNGTQFFTKMNLASFRVYNRALSEDEIHHNYIIDKNKYGIEE